MKTSTTTQPDVEKKMLITIAKFKSRMEKEINDDWHQLLHFRNCTGNSTNPLHLTLMIVLYDRFHPNLQLRNRKLKKAM